MNIAAGVFIMVNALSCFCARRRSVASSSVCKHGGKKADRLEYPGRYFILTCGYGSLNAKKN
ncbi:unnamed protein product, partial [Ranitomeya imitator]